MKPFKNKLAVTIVLLSVAFCGMIIYSLQSDANGISSSVSTVVSPLQKIVYNIYSPTGIFKIQAFKYSHKAA